MEFERSPNVCGSSFRASERAVLCAIVVLFAMGTSILSWNNARTNDLAPRFHWPDETSNAYFASRVARGAPLAVAEPRNAVSGNLIHPRTVNVRADGALVPGSYLGIPLWYGLLGRLMGERALLFLTPILAALGLLAFASIVRHLAGATTALIATTLLALHPSLWLFTATTFLPNVPFVALLLFGFALLLPGSSSRGEAEGSHVVASKSDGMRSFTSFRMTRWAVRWFAGGLLLGLALTIRTHEIVWVFVITAMVVSRNCSGGLQAATHQAIGWRAEARRYTIPAALFLIGLVLPFIPILILNAQLYGSPFTTGYALLQDGGALPTEFTSSVFPSWLTALIAPFGWHPAEALARFWRYTVIPFPWFTALVAAGMLSQFRTNVRKNCDGRWCAVAGTMALATWFVLYYGSWTISDPLVRETNVLTISYVRYWLPIVVLLAPWAAVGCRWILEHIPSVRRSLVAPLIILGIALTSFMQIVTDPTEGLLRQRAAIDEHRVRARAVIAATPPDAIIISHRMDKVFFPERAVVHAPENPNTDVSFASRLATLADTAPIYWYAVSTPILPEFVFEPIGAMPFGEQLYHVKTR